MSPKFIVLEGPDGAGTSTHSRLLADRFMREGKPFFLTAEPTNGPIGQGIRGLLKRGGISGSALQLLFSADRADHQDAINAAIAEGKTVICDRYIPSTIAYGSALHLNVSWLRDVNRLFRKPDHTILLLPPLDVCHRRMKKRLSRDILEQDSLQDHIYDAYKMLAEGDPSIRVIDSSKAVEETSEEIMEIIQNKL